jgi:hypothetical protein
MYIVDSVPEVVREPLGDVLDRGNQGEIPANAGEDGGNGRIGLFLTHRGGRLEVLLDVCEQGQQEVLQVYIGQLLLCFLLSYWITTFISFIIVGIDNSKILNDVDNR